MYFKKHLRFKSLIELIKEEFDRVEDWRGKNKSNSISDVMLSGLACMYFQCPSLLDFQRGMEIKSHKNNLQSMFKVSSTPTDTGMRTIIDEVDTETAFRGIFKEFYQRLQRGKHLEEYQIFPGKYLLNVDGTQYFQSSKIKCKKCLERGKKGKEYNCHQVLQGAIVKAGLKQVIPVMPEEICTQDGDNKEDCEINAFKRFIDKFTKDHNKLGVIINGDALYASIPVIKKIHEHNANYIFKVKHGSHKFLIESVKSKVKERTYGKSRRGNKLVIDWINDVQLFSSYDEKVNYMEAWEIVPQKDGSNKTQYYGRWITDLEITNETAKIILDSARARWKIENECFNTLKNHGYEIEHNYGHGEKNLSFNFYAFTLLAFFIHQIHQLTDNIFKKVRSLYGRLESFWNDIRSFINRFYCQGLEELWLWMIETHITGPPLPSIE